MISKFLLVLILLCILARASGECGVCQTNYAMCHDKDHFSMCNEGKPEEKIYTCPNGYVCTKKTSVCIPQSETNSVVPSCQMICGLCNSHGRLFACMSDNTYALCFGESVPDLSTQGNCPDGYVCNLDSNEICTKNSEPSCNAEIKQSTPTTVVIYDKLSTVRSITSNEVTSIKPTTPMTSVETTQSSLPTTRSSLDESKFCKDKQLRGPYKSQDDLTCREYILCYFLAGQYLELKYTCSGSDFFNEETKSCQTDKPSYC